MQVPLQLQFRDMDPDPHIEDRVRRRADRLERLCDDLISCRVLVAEPHSSATSGSPWRVRIEARVPPGHELVVHKKPGDHDLGDSLETVVTNAFDAMERQLKSVVERRRHEVKQHDESWGLVSYLNQDEGFGFFKTELGRDIYFHRNAVAGDDFDRLEIGTRVRFEEAMGRDGPQATTVQIIDKPGARASDEPPEPAEPPAGW
ncbi:MAG TPA: HPF/RaiA family ribosome-associated protein [Candidatus Sulfomarinibacteraceae bacterium]|nr:HPF/RaiA family ribosome-associated protein [Candidatus Sulfomarinibacteraceae bacterium]